MNLSTLDELAKFYPNVPSEKIDTILIECNGDSIACLDRLEALERQSCGNRHNWPPLPDPIRGLDNDECYRYSTASTDTASPPDLPSPVQASWPGTPLYYGTAPRRCPKSSSKSSSRASNDAIPDGRQGRARARGFISDSGSDSAGSRVSRRTLSNHLHRPQVVPPVAPTSTSAAAPPPRTPQRSRSSSLRRKAKAITSLCTSNRLADRIRRSSRERRHQKSGEQMGRGLPSCRSVVSDTPTMSSSSSQIVTDQSDSYSASVSDLARVDSGFSAASTRSDRSQGDPAPSSPGRDARARLPMLAPTSSEEPSLFYLNVLKVAERLREREKQQLLSDTVEVPAAAASILCTLTGRPQREENIRAGKRILTIRTSGLMVQQLNMVDDGNCLFRAIAHQIYGTQERHLEVRRHCTAQLDEDPTPYSILYDTQAEYDRYRTGMRAPGVWGDEVALKAICDRLHIVAYVLTSTPGNWYLRYVPSDMEVPEFCRAKNIFLTYLFPIHYNALAYLDGTPISLRPEEVAALPELVCDTRRVSRHAS